MYKWAAMCALIILIFGVWYQNRELNSGKEHVGQNTMRTISYSRWGSPDVLEMVDTPVPDFDSNEILVKVFAASINPVDYKILAGNFNLLSPLLTFRPGFDFSGRVVATGSHCNRLKVGDYVHGMTPVYKTGTLSEFIAISESVASLIPDSTSPQHAAALPLVSLTSYNSLVTVGRLKSGSRVLILGGSSATGIMAVQISKALGAKVIVTTCSPRNNALLKDLGADEVVDYQSVDVFEEMAKRGQQFDIIYDTVAAGRYVWEGASAQALAPGGQLVTITGDTQGAFGVVELLTRGYQLVSRKLYCWFAIGGGASYHQYTQMAGEHVTLDWISQSLRRGALRAVVDREYAFELSEVQDAFRYLMDGHATGKIIVNIARAQRKPNDSANV